MMFARRELPCSNPPRLQTLQAASCAHVPLPRQAVSLLLLSLPK
jgi:hypothetical protein